MKFEIYLSPRAPTAANEWPSGISEWRWRLRARNGRIVADGGEGYTSPIKLVYAVRKYVCGRDAASNQALDTACRVACLTRTGRRMRAPQ